MNETKSLPDLFKWILAAFALWTLMFALACRLPDPDRAHDGALLGIALAGTRGELSGEWVAQADRFLHQGVGAYKPRVFSDPLTRLSDALSPREHSHLRGASAAEVMPWLWLAVRTDPNNVEAYVTAAFWMAGEVGRPDLAMELMDEARTKNPRDYRVRLEQARLFLRMGEISRAWSAIGVARKLWDLRHDDLVDAEQALIDAAEILTYHGLLKEDRGDIPGAMADYTRILSWFPGRSGLRARLQRLAAGESIERPPAAEWKENLAARRHVCAFETTNMGAMDHEHDVECNHEHDHEHKH